MVRPPASCSAPPIPPIPVPPLLASPLSRVNSSFPLPPRLLGVHIQILHEHSNSNGCPSTCFHSHFTGVVDSHHLICHRLRSLFLNRATFLLSKRPLALQLFLHSSLNVPVQVSSVIRFNIHGRPSASTASSSLGFVTPAPTTPSYTLLLACFAHRTSSSRTPA